MEIKSKEIPYEDNRPSLERNDLPRLAVIFSLVKNFIPVSLISGHFDVVTVSAW